ncbi:pyruvate:ferredoxin (flavodoxin) oxidoreductase [Desulfopila sp. IMCC35006]|uniref:pyruvate:ferredoxin (flavodoxin) oxidoreductase n=1 Tax=Desulfopila sp. IMCC35006 TaxID=2569542 RepID=UPI0010AD459C|nr:pyruvate:ferredoxin (flavodoxin) oxidoreductase [Desulfopila sp. IMCC35006]TKB24577.1 pyruvate:ferredoxin (flavodoxin) oxidoreductase [Desulfopila sp. IMCC35006]
MAERRKITVDGNEAAVSIAHRLSEVICIYPITPSSPMGEFADEWSACKKPNIWGTVPQVTEMQSEAGAIGAAHGVLQTGALTTTFTSSQGLLLMLPNMYKIAGELTSYTMHVAARALATHALSIFGDHSDVMACRQTGFAMLASGSVQETHDLAIIAHTASLQSRVPFLHFFDGFRTSHEVAKIDELIDQDLLAMIDYDTITAHRKRALTPDHPLIRGTAENPDTFFQSREASNLFYMACPEIVRQIMDQFAELTGRKYQLFDYVGHHDAELVIILMGSGAEVAQETVEWMVNQGEKVGLVKVRLYRPFSVKEFVASLPRTVKRLAVLDRTKEPGSVGEPLYLDVVSALREARHQDTFPIQEPDVIGGRYGLSSKEFNPAMVKGVFDELKKDNPKNHFTVGIIDDVTHTSLDYDLDFDIEPDDVVRGVFFGLGADGTVGANKNSIKIIGEETPNYAQGYFVYDSKKSGGVTISHLRFGPRIIRSSYLIKQASFVACHQFMFLDKYDILDYAAPNAVFLLNSQHGPQEVWDHLPREVQEQIIEKSLVFYVIDAYKVAQDTGMGARINTIMQTCFFAISGVLEREEAIAKIKGAIEKTYGKKGHEVVRKNFEAVNETLANLHQVKVPSQVTSIRTCPPTVSPKAPEFVKRVEAVMMAGKGDSLPVSALPVGGTWPMGTTQWEKRNIAREIPAWDPAVCIQCAKCSFVCPHAAIRTKVYGPEQLEAAPPAFKSVDAKGKEYMGKKFTVQVAPEDCTGCRLCVMTCPGINKSKPRFKAINMEPQLSLREQEQANWAFFLDLPEAERTQMKMNVKNSQLLSPLFEFSGCCAGCGETQYIKLLTQLFGDRSLIANATGCSSIYGGNLPTTPFNTNKEGRGPAWSNSLFEDNAEFGFGMRLALDKHIEQGQELLKGLATQVGKNLASSILEDDQSTEANIKIQRERVASLKERLASIKDSAARRLELLADYFVKKNVWIVGGDGWAYDIGYGGLDHVLAMGRNVNILVLDTEVYSNTGGQQSKATSMGAVAKFASSGKTIAKKDLGLMAMSYENVYVARVAFGANDQHTVKAFLEAESYPGTSLIIAYSPCIAHGYDLAYGGKQQKLAVDSGYWPIYRFDPRRTDQNLNPFQLDSGAPKVPLADYMYNESRFRMLQKLDPERASALLAKAQKEAKRHFALYEQLSQLKEGGSSSETPDK